MIKYFSILVVIITFSITPSESWAQYRGGSSSGQKGGLKEVMSGSPAEKRIGRWKESLNKIKDDIANLVRENNKLVDKYKDTKKDLLNLQDTINDVKLQNRNIENDTVRIRKLLRSKENEHDKLLLREQKLRTDIIEHESKRASLQEDLKDVNQAIKLWEIQVSELNTRKNKLALELKLEENKREDIKKGQASVIKDLQDELTEVQSEEKQVLSSIDQLNTRRLNILEDIKKTKDDNTRLREQIADLKQQKEDQIKNNRGLRMEYSKTKNETQREYQRLVNERKKIETKVLGLEAKLDKVKKSIEKSMKIQEEKRGLINEIMRLDDENQELRNKISELQTEVDAVKAKGMNY